jgi:hypothetical protein
MLIVQPSLTSQNIIDITNYVNAYRARNQAPPITWNDTIASFAQNWSYFMTSNNLFQHSGTPLYGENISYFEGYGTDPMKLIFLAIDGWYNEISLYDFSNPGFSDTTGHFTCLVWLSTTSFGMGISINKNTGRAYISFNTSPPGNIIGEFQQNVLPLTPPLPIPVPPIPIKTTNKQLVISQLLNIINEINSRYDPNAVIADINIVIQEIENSSPF